MKEYILIIYVVVFLCLIYQPFRRHCFGSRTVLRAVGKEQRGIAESLVRLGNAGTGIGLIRNELTQLLCGINSFPYS